MQTRFQRKRYGANLYDAYDIALAKANERKIKN